MRKNSLVEDLSEFRNTLPLGANDFLCIYGSTVYDDSAESSDVDMFIVTDSDELLSLEFQDRFLGFIVRLHDEYERQLDTEVPYHNKLIYSHDEIRRATRLDGFSVNPESGNLFIPTIVKSREFLSSPQIKLRLALNALTTPHLVIDQQPAYRRHLKAAGVAITAVGVALCDSSFTQEDLCEKLTRGQNDETGEMYLGYKTESDVVEEHLANVTSLGLLALTDNDLLEYNERTYVRTEQFNPFQVAGYFTNLREIF